jgi:hypothetical protein
MFLAILIALKYKDSIVSHSSLGVSHCSPYIQNLEVFFHRSPFKPFCSYTLSMKYSLTKKIWISGINDGLCSSRLLGHAFCLTQWVNLQCQSSSTIFQYLWSCEKFIFPNLWSCAKFIYQILGETSSISRSYILFTATSTCSSLFAYAL